MWTTPPSCNGRQRPSGSLVISEMLRGRNDLVAFHSDVFSERPNRHHAAATQDGEAVSLEIVEMRSVDITTANPYVDSGAS